jgi:hypothetical protein
MLAPASIDLSKLAAQEPIVAHATLSTNGSYTLTGAADDQDATTGNDLKLAVGDFVAKHAREPILRAG